MMERQGRSDIATFVMRDKQHLVAILAAKGIWRPETLRFSDELRAARELGLPVAGPRFKGRGTTIRKNNPRKPAQEISRDEARNESAGMLRQLVERKQRRHNDMVRTKAEEPGRPMRSASWKKLKKAWQWKEGGLRCYRCRWSPTTQCRSAATNVLTSAGPAMVHAAQT